MMESPILAIFKMISDMDLENWYIKIQYSIKDIGLIIRLLNRYPIIRNHTRNKFWKMITIN
jgi:hypothetical protein